MAQVFETPAVTVLIKERGEQIFEAWESKFRDDEEFYDVVTGPVALIDALAETSRNPQDPRIGPDDKWNGVMMDLAEDHASIGLLARKLRYLLIAVEECVVHDLPNEERIESVTRLHRAVYFGLETAARAVAREIATAAFHSMQTGLRNKSGFDVDIAKIEEGDGRYRVAYIDMDGLKRINDEYGHNAGDDALRELAQALYLEMGEGDTPFHFHGDEFAILSRATDVEYLEEMLNRIRGSGCPRFSFGVAGSDERPTRKEVLDLADARMQEDKRARKARGDAPERAR